MKNKEKIKAAICMRNYYLDLAERCKIQYDDLVVFYIMYDHYMGEVKKYVALLEELLEEE